MDGQDWDPIVLRKKAKPTTVIHKQASASVSQQRKLETDEPVKIKRLSNESKQQMIQARVKNTWNQTQLNNQCAFPPNTIRDIECGKLQPTPAQLNILNRVLKLALKYESPS